MELGLSRQGEMEELTMASLVERKPNRQFASPAE
jgi:hypothetical protein